MKQTGYVQLSDNRDLAESEFRECKQLAEAIRNSIGDREKFVRDRGLNPEFCLPAALWALDGNENDFHVAYKHVLNGNYQVLNRLRFFSQAYTGYQLMFLREGRGYNSVNALPADYEEWLKKRLARSDLWIYKWLEATKYLPANLVFSPPWVMGEIGWRIDDIVVNHDTYVYQERINILYENGIVDWLLRLAEKREIRILEIGGGYGALAHALLGILNKCSYSICDLPESLLFSGSYLKVAGAGKVHFHSNFPIDFELSQINLLPNYLFPLLAGSGQRFDLIINTSSFSELSAVQLDGYCRGISSLIGDQGIFYEQNQPIGVSGDVDCKKRIAEHLPYRNYLTSTMTRPMEGPAEVWSNRPFHEIVDQKLRPNVRGPAITSSLVRKVRTLSYKIKGRFA